MRNHGDRIKMGDLSNNGKYLATCSEDRNIIVYTIKDFEKKDLIHVKGKVDFDYAKVIRWSPDNKALLIVRDFNNVVEVYRVSKNADGIVDGFEPACLFPKKHDKDIFALEVACNGKYIMTCSEDTTLIIWSIKGQVLYTLDTKLMYNYSAHVSPCARFVGASGFGPEVKVWQLVWDKKTGEFVDLKKAFQLKGHTAAVYDFAFNNDSTRMASVSRDGTWKIWNTDVRFEMDEDPRLLLTGSYGDASSRSEHALVALAPDALSVVIASNLSIAAFSALTGKQEGCIENAFHEEIVSLRFDSDGRYFMAAGDSALYVFHNVAGLIARVADLVERKKKATGASVRERIDAQIEEAKRKLQSIVGPK